MGGRDASTGRLHPVWGLTASLVALVLVATLRLLDGLGPLPAAPVALPWWVLAPLFYVSELTVIHLRFSRHAHTFSLTEIPLVVGLHLADPVHLLAGQTVGALAAFGPHRRQAPVKLGFNTAQFALQTVTAVLVFRAAAGSGPPLGLAHSAGALLAVLAALVVANLLVNGAIHLSGGRLTLREMRNVLTLGAVAALMNGALGLVAVHVVWLRPESAWLAAVPPAILFLAYRAYVSQREERSRLASIYEVTRELHETPQIEAALQAVTARARSLFQAELAEVTLLTEGAGDDAFLTGSGPAEEGRVMTRVARRRIDPLVLRCLEERGAVLERNGPDRHAPGVAMAAPLFEREAPIGAFVVRHPLGEVSSFGPSDLAMLVTLAAQVSVSLENGRLEDSLAQLTRLKEELHHQTLHDGLTGLANRRLLQDRLELAIHSAGAGNEAALLFLDLDEFKAVNDSLGHAAGDELLRMVGDRLQSACRPGDTVARIGGDEFAVLLVGLGRPGEAEHVSERVLDALRRPFVLRGHPVFISASLGIALVGEGDGCDDTLRRADQAMYTAKWREKGSFEVFAGSSGEGVRRWMELRADLPGALGDGSVELHYQPVVELESGEVVGAEGLIRWTHPRLGRVEPPELLSVAEEAGLMGELAAWTVARAAADAADLRRSRPRLWVSVNMAPDQVEPGVVDRVAAELSAHHLAPEALVVEITETTANLSSEAVLEKLAALGVRVALDDFGTGYSSLARLDTLPIDLLKIDRSFVARTTTPDGSPLIRVMLEIGATLGLDTIAEGVETMEHRQALLALGCRYAQGYLFSPAVPLAELRRSLTPSPAAPTPSPPPS